MTLAQHVKPILNEIASRRDFEKFSSAPFCVPIYPLLIGETAPSSGLALIFNLPKF